MVGFEEAFVGAHGDGFGDEFEALFDDFWAATALLVVELGDGGGLGFLDGLEAGPFGEQGAGERGEEVAPDELEGLWVVVFEGLSELVGEAGADVNELASFFDEGGNLAREGVGGGVGLKSGVSFVDELGEGPGVSFVVFGPGGGEAFAVFFDDGGVDEIDGKEMKLAEEMDEVLAGLFDAEGDGLPVWDVGGELLDPGEEGFGGGGDFVLSEDVARGVEDAGVDGLV